VIEEIQDSDFLAVVGEFADVFAYVVVDRELALFFKEQDARRGELF